MRDLVMLADDWHPLVREKAMALTGTAPDERAKIEALFLYVRDGIRFGYPRGGDLVSASSTIALGYGQCNTKSTLFVALCRAAGIQARVHYSLIRKEIQRGIFPGFAYRLMPDKISHSWVEVLHKGKWRALDSFINDSVFFRAGRQKLKEKGWDIGYSIACTGGDATDEFSLEGERFVQMDAVTDDHGVWEDPAEYFRSGMYRNRPGFIKLMLYGLIVWFVNRRVERMRSGCTAGLCGAPAGMRGTRA